MPTPHKLLNSEDASNPTTSPIVDRDNQDNVIRPHQGKKNNQHVPIQRPDRQQDSINVFSYVLDDNQQQLVQTPIKSNEV